MPHAYHSSVLCCQEGRSHQDILDVSSCQFELFSQRLQVQVIIRRSLGRQEEDSFVGFEPGIVGISAGFDTYLEDWRELLRIEDYRMIGEAIREGAEE